MSDPFIVALIALGISLIASAVRMIDWFMHSDPRAVARMARWAVIVVAALSIPLLLFLLVKEQWTAAIALAAGMILVAAALGARMLRWIGFRTVILDRSAPAGANPHHGFDEGFVDDPELVRRSAAVLETYLRRTSGPAQGNGADLPAIEGKTNGRGRAKANGHAESADPGTMPQDEALAILGLETGATEREITEAHSRIAQKIDPASGGSRYLAFKVDRAKESLLRIAHESSARVSSKTRNISASRAADVQAPARVMARRMG